MPQLIKAFVVVVVVVLLVLLLFRALASTSHTTRGELAHHTLPGLTPRRKVILIHDMSLKKVSKHHANRGKQAHVKPSNGIQHATQGNFSMCHANLGKLENHETKCVMFSFNWIFEIVEIWDVKINWWCTVSISALNRQDVDNMESMRDDVQDNLHFAHHSCLLSSFTY